MNTSPSIVRPTPAAPLTIEPALIALRSCSSTQATLTKIQEIAARIDIPVLLLGEPGSGREDLGRTIHRLGRRSSGPFVSVDCRGLSATDFEVHLFGSECGVGPVDGAIQIGALERASGGTLFLGDLNALSERAQTALAQVLKRGSFRRRGSVTEIPLDLRIISAMHEEISPSLQPESIRPDLYYRLSVVALFVPPLRERKQDIPQLVKHFAAAEESGAVQQLLLCQESLERLHSHDWPGNLPELENVVRRAVATGQMPSGLGQTHVQADDLKQSEWIALPPQRSFKEARKAVLRSFEYQFLQRLLQLSAGNVSLAAREAGIARSYLNNMLRRHRLL